MTDALATLDDTDLAFLTTGPKQPADALQLPAPGEPEPSGFKKVVAYTDRRDENGESALVQANIPKKLARVVDKLVAQHKFGSLPYQTRSDFIVDAIWRWTGTLHRWMEQQHGWDAHEITSMKRLTRYAEEAEQQLRIRRDVDVFLAHLRYYLADAGRSSIQRAIKDTQFWVGTLVHIEEDDPFWAAHYIRPIVRSPEVRRILNALQASDEYKDQSWVLTLGAWYDRYRAPEPKVQL